MPKKIQNKEPKEPGKEPGADTVTLQKTQLDSILKQMEEMKKTNSLLMEVADKRALAQYYSKHGKELPKVIKLRTIEGKLVVGWRSIANIVSQNPATGIWTENQRTEIIFEDGTRKEMSMLEFENSKVMIETTRVGQINNEETGQMALKLRRHDNNQEVLIAIEFVN